MALPKKALPTTEVTLGSEVVTIRSLSRSEALRLTTSFKDNADGAENFVLACGAGVSEEEAEEWRNSTDPTTAGLVIDEILKFTGLAGQEDKSPQASTRDNS
jgi:hypothetical protein